MRNEAKYRPIEPLWFSRNKLIHFVNARLNYNIEFQFGVFK